MKGGYTMQVDIEFEFDESKLTALDVMDLFDYHAKVKVKLNDQRVNILNAHLKQVEQ